MTQTLRRELRVKFVKTILLWIRDSPAITDVSGDTLLVEEEVKKFAGLLADDAFDVSAIQKRADLAKTSIEAAIFGDMPVTEEMVTSERTRQDAQNEFERALGFSKPLPWTIDRDWEAFGAWVVEKYQPDPQVFQRYETWRNQPYVRGAIDNKRLRGFVAEFYDSFDMFKKQDKVEEAPRYKPLPEDNNHYVPNPNRRTS